MFNIFPINRTKRKLASWQCYKSGHKYSYQQLQKASVKLWSDESGTIKCQRCSTEVDIEDCQDNALRASRINRALFK